MRFAGQGGLAGTGQAGGRLRCSQRKPIIRSAPPSSFPRLLPAAATLGRETEGERGEIPIVLRKAEKESDGVRPRVRLRPCHDRCTNLQPTHPRLAPSLTCCRGGRDAAQRSEKTLTPKMRIAAACLSASLPRCHSEAASIAADSQKLLRRRGGHTRINGQGFPLSHQSLG